VLLYQKRFCGNENAFDLQVHWQILEDSLEIGRKTKRNVQRLTTTLILNWWEFASVIWLKPLVVVRTAVKIVSVLFGNHHDPTWASERNELKDTQNDSSYRDRVDVGMDPINCSFTTRRPRTAGSRLPFISRYKTRGTVGRTPSLGSTVSRRPPTTAFSSYLILGAFIYSILRRIEPIVLNLCIDVPWI
jgi:hypothetical protein